MTLAGEDKEEISMLNGTTCLEQKKSKVIFSVKKDQSQQNTSMFRKRGDSASHQIRSTVKGDKNSSIETATKGD